MTDAESGLRAKAHAVYALTDELQVRLRVLDESTAAVKVAVIPSNASDNEGDIEAIAFLVLIEASRSAQEDLKAIMASVRAITNAKDGWRRRPDDRRRSHLDFESVLHLAAALYAKQLTAELHEIQDDLDSSSELGEMESLRLQMAMDRMSKMMTTLSNLMKKVAEASDSIVQNLK